MPSQLAVKRRKSVAPPPFFDWNIMSDRFDFEQQITKCWFVVDDLKELDEMIFEEYVKFNKDSISNHILGIANSYDVKFHKLWHLFETVYMDTVKENKMLNEECAALRQQLIAEQSGYVDAGTKFGQLEPQGFGKPVPFIRANNK
jgi:hypothetical protein